MFAAICLIAALGCCKELNLIVDSPRSWDYWMTWRDDLAKFLELRTNEHWTSQVTYLNTLENSPKLSELKGDFVIDFTEQLLNRHEIEKTFNTFENYTLGGKPIVVKPKQSSNVVDMLASAQAIIQLFAWSKPLILVENKYFAEILELEFNQFLKLSVSATSSQEEIENIISREVRPTGIKQLFLLANFPLTNKLLAALAKFEIESGYSIILIGSDCIFNISLYPTGIICVALEGLETFFTEAEVEIWYIFKALHSLNPKKSIVNVIDGQKRVVGSIEGTNATLESAVLFPGKIATPPENTPVVLKVGLAGWKSPKIPNHQKGAVMALDDFKLSNNRFVISPVDLKSVCEEFVSDYLSCYQATKAHKTTLLLTYEYQLPIFLEMLWQASTGLRIPTIEACAQINYLSSPINFPNFIQLTQSLDYLATHYGLLAKNFEYTQCNLVYNIVYGTESFDIMQKNWKGRGIEIATPFELVNFQGKNPEYLKKLAMFIKKSNLRLLFIFLLYDEIIDSLLPALEEVGLKNGDIVFIGASKTHLILKQQSTTKEGDRIVEKFKDNFFIFIWNSYTSKLGAQVKERFEKEFTIVTWYDCYIYDTMALAVTALDFGIRRGINYYDWVVMMKAVRLVRFAGCTGMVSFSFEHNDRKDVAFSLTQTQMVDGELKDVTKMIVSLSGSNAVKALLPIEWADGKSQPPMNRLTYDGCPFPEQYRRTSDESIKTSTMINFILVGFTIATSIAAYFLVYRKDQMIPVKEPILLGTQDLLAVVACFGDMIFIILFSPSSLFFSVSIPESFLQSYDFADGKLFLLLNAVYTCTLLGIVTALCCALHKFKPFKLDIQLISFAVFRFAYIPLVFLMMSTFDCSEASSEFDDFDLDDSFLDFDCYESCWKGKHLKYSIVSAVLLCLLNLVSILTSSSVTNTLEGLQFDTSPLYLLLRQPILMTLIAIFKAEPAMSLASQSSLYLIVVGIFAAFCLKFKVIALPTYNNYCIAILGWTFVYSLLSSLHYMAFKCYWLWLSLTLASAIVILIVLFIRQRNRPTFIKKPDEVNVMLLFNFAFKLNKRYEDMKRTYLSVPFSSNK